MAIIEYFGVHCSNSPPVMKEPVVFKHINDECTSHCLKRDQAPISHETICLHSNLVKSCETLQKPKEALLESSRVEKLGALISSKNAAIIFVIFATDYNNLINMEMNSMIMKLKKSEIDKHIRSMKEHEQHKAYQIQCYETTLKAVNFLLSCPKQQIDFKNQSQTVFFGDECHRIKLNYLHSDQILIQDYQQSAMSYCRKEINKEELRNIRDNFSTNRHLREIWQDRKQSENKAWTPLKRIVRSSWIRLAKVMASMLCGVSLGEEESMLTGATVSFTYGTKIIDSGSHQNWEMDEFIHGSFKSWVITDSADAKVHVTIDLKQPKKVVSIFLVNHAWGINTQRLLGDGDELNTDYNNEIVWDVTDGGFFEVPNTPLGQYLTLGREQTSTSNKKFELNSLRVYQTPNLLKVNESSVSITSDTSKSEIGFEAINLISNLEHRSPGNDLYAITSSVPYETLEPQNTCYKVSYQTIKSNQNTLIFGFDLGKTFFIHAVLHVQDMLQQSRVDQNSDRFLFLQNYELYIGNSPDYKENNRCAGGPFLDPSESNSYIFNQRIFTLNNRPFSDQDVGMVWPFGMENWCNLEGQFIHYVANQSQQVAAASDSDTVSVCSVGIYGTEYVRNGDKVPSSIKIIQGESTELLVTRINSSLSIGNDLQIALRQKTDLSFVTITEMTSYSEVKINTADQETGEYSLTLESFNELSQAKSALKTDTIVIQVLASPLEPSTLSAKTLTPGSAETWKHPLQDFLADNDQWSVETLIEAQLQTFISYDTNTQEFSFNGNEQSKQLVNQFLKITYILENGQGDTSNLTQIITIVPSEDQLLQEGQNQDEQTSSNEQEQAESEATNNESQEEDQVQNTNNENQQDQKENLNPITVSENIDEQSTTLADEYNDEAFKYVSLDDRLDQIVDNDLGSFYAMILKQKELAKQAVAKSVSENGQRPPEMRIGSISANRSVSIEFTNTMKFPSTTDFIKLNKDFKLIDVKMLSGSEEGGINKNLLFWKISQVTPSSISIQLDFDNPLQVSQGESPDLLVIQAGLGEYTDENNQRLPLCVVRVNEIPLQYATATNAETSKYISNISSKTTITVFTAQLSLNFFLQASLNRLLSMLNTQQIANSMPMYEKLKIPPFSMQITKEMVQIANFDVIPTDWLSEKLWDYWPEDDAFSLNFETAGFENKLFLQNVGFNFYLVVLIVLIGFLHVILHPLRRKCACILKVTNRMENYLYFNGTIRFFVEIFFEICLQASLNLYTIQWTTPFYQIETSNALSIIFLGLICIMPVIYISISCIRPKIWSNESFENRCGKSLFEGTNIEKHKNGERALLFLPIMFLMRRAIFVILVLLFQELVWLQLAVQFGISMAIIIHLQWYEPFQEKALNKIETFNEITLILLTYFLLCFTDFVPDAVTRNDLGYYYSAITLMNITVHILIMIRSSYGKIRLYILKRRQAKRKKVTSSKRPLSNDTNQPQQRQRRRRTLLHTIDEIPEENQHSSQRQRIIQTSVAIQNQHQNEQQQVYQNRELLQPTAVNTTLRRAVQRQQQRQRQHESAAEAERQKNNNEDMWTLE